MAKIIKEKVCRRFLEEEKESINQNNSSAGTIIDLTLQERNREVKEEIEKLREELANLEHEQWIKWSQTTIDDMLKDSLSGTDACKVRDNVLARHQRWLPMWKSYEDLPEDIKEFDREWADKIIEKLKQNLGVVKDGKR